MFANHRATTRPAVCPAARDVESERASTCMQPQSATPWARKLLWQATDRATASASAALGVSLLQPGREGIPQDAAASGCQTDPSPGCPSIQQYRDRYPFVIAASTSQGSLSRFAGRLSSLCSVGKKAFFARRTGHGQANCSPH